MKGSGSNTRQAFWVGVGSFSTFLIGLVTAAVLSRLLDKQEYGTYRQILYVYNTLLIVFTAGLPRVFSYFLPRYGLPEGKEIVFKISRVLFLTGLVFSLFLFFFSGIIAQILRNPELARGLKYFSPVPMLLLPTLGIEGIFSTYKKTLFIAIYNVLSRSLVFVFILIPVLLISKSYLYAIYGWVISSFIILLVAYYFKNIPYKGVKPVKSGLSFREILAYSLPIVSASIAGTIFRSANQFYISRYFGTEVFADFSNGFMEIPLVGMITSATSVVLMPVFSKAVYEKSDTAQITGPWRNALNKSAILIYPMVVFFLFYSKEVVTIIYSKAYESSSVFFSIAIVQNFFNIIIFAPLLLSLGKSKFYARLFYGLAAATWVFEYAVIKIFNTPVSVAVCFVVVSVCGTLISLFYSARLLGTSFFKLFPIGRLLVIGLHSLLSIVIVRFIMIELFPELHTILNVGIGFVLYVIVLLPSARVFKINYREILIPLFKRN